MYIDPAAGSLVLQIVIAGAISALAFMRRARRATKTFFVSLLNRHHR